MAKIRIIDDDVDQSEYMSEVLRRAGYDVTVSDRTIGALEAIETGQPDLVVLDVMFPENPAGGLELAIKMRQNEKTKHIPVILLTSVNKEFAVGLSEKDIDPQWMPVQNFLDKPVESQTLLRKVAELLKKP